MRLFCTLLVVIGLCLTHVNGFTFLSKFKMPDFNKIINPPTDKFQGKKLCVITGTSSGLGKQTAKHLLKTGQWHVVGACRDVDKMKTIMEEEGFDSENFTVLECNLNSFSSVKSFVAKLLEFKEEAPIDRFVCNAAVYQPSLPEPKWSEDGIEQQIQTNFLSHFLMCSMLMPHMKEADKPRIIMVGSITGNDNTVGGGGVYPIADLHELDGMKNGCKNPISMMDGYNFNGAKGYKDTKLALMMLSNILHDKYHKSTGIAFSSIYPGCIADSPLFREKRKWFREFFPVFMKYITGGYVSEPEAGERLFQVITDRRCSKSGVYWSWNGGPREGRGVDAIKNGGKIIGAGGAGGDWDSIYENDQSDKVRDPEKAADLFKLATQVTGAEWPAVKSPVSPCPTLRVIGFITKLLDGQQERKRARDSPRTMKEFLERGGFNPEPIPAFAAAKAEQASYAYSI